MKLIKNAFLLLALVLGLTFSSAVATAEESLVNVPEESGASVDFVFVNPSLAHVFVNAPPGSAFYVRCPDTFGNVITLTSGAVDADGATAKAFNTPPFVNVTMITVLVMPPSQPGLFFSFDGELDRWILD